ncbi:MFS transporter [Kamptonema formosum]|uniref:MFS transporter n=1 Tax=Kamptonema formosum TaxID=331992 RepID=UPI00036D56D0|nr:MFS transporter [Oscillatoria sp. PCC 10802]
MKVFSTLEPNQRRSLVILFAAGLLFWCNIASLLPTVPLYVQHVGGTKQQIGLVMGAFALGLLPSRPWLGPLADRQGRKIVLLLGAGVAATAPLGYLVVTSIPGLIAIRAFHGISVAAFTTGYSALVTDLSPPRQRGEIIGYMSLSNPIGVAIGPAVGGFLQESAGYPPLFLMAASLGALALLCVNQVREPGTYAAGRPERQNAAKEASAASSGGLPSSSPEREKFWQLLWSPRLRIPTLVMLAVGLVFGTLSTYMPLFIKETGVNLNAGLFYTAAAVASFSARLFTGRASDRYGRGLPIACSLVCYTAAMLALWGSNSPAAFLLAAWLEGSASGTLIPTIVALVADRCGPQQRGRFFSLCVGGFDLGLALAGPILGAIAEVTGYRNMFAIAAGLALLALILFITQSSKDLAHSLRFATGRGKDIYAFDKS